MRRITAAAIAALFACIASAQMKPTQAPQAKGTIGTSNSNVGRGYYQLLDTNQPLEIALLSYLSTRSRSL